MSPALKATVAILVAAVLGLGIALAVVAGDSEDEPASPNVATESVVPTEPPATTPTASQAQTTQTTSTAPTTTESTAPTTTTTELTTEPTTTTETDGSGGLEVP